MQVLLHHLCNLFPGYQTIFRLGTPHFIMLKPLYVRNIYSTAVSNSTNKAWLFFVLHVLVLVLFIYLDLIPDSSAVTCIGALRIFFSNHGVPNKTIYVSGNQFGPQEFQLFCSSKGIS